MSCNCMGPAGNCACMQARKAVYQPLPAAALDESSQAAISFMMWRPEPFQVNDKLGKILKTDPHIELAAQWLVQTHIGRRQYPNWQRLFEHTEAKCITLGIDPSDLLGGLGKFEL